MTGPLKAVFEAEIAAGNAFKEEWFDWPEGWHSVLLMRPFGTPIRRDLAGVEFVNINDPHYWKAEYRDFGNCEVLACMFGDVPDFSAM